MAIATRNADPDAPFTLASLVGEAGSGANGEKLVQTLRYHYPPELEAATLKRVNARLTSALDQAAMESVVKIAGAPADSDLNVKVRGGLTRERDAVVVYAFHDETGQLWKGCFPYEDLGKPSSERHVAQKDAIMNAPAAADYARVQAKIRAAQRDPEADSLRERVAELEAQLEESGQDPAPAEYEGRNAREIATLIADAPRETAERLQAYERAHEDRATIVNAADKRLNALDADDRAAADAQAAQAAEVERLRARVAELEGPTDTPDTAA